MGHFTTDELRKSFLIENMLHPNCIYWQFTSLDDLALGGVVPCGSPINIDCSTQLNEHYLVNGRELGAINIGGPGNVTVDGIEFIVKSFGCIYIGLGAENISFASRCLHSPARYILFSCPAGRYYPTRVMQRDEPNAVYRGTATSANLRISRTYIHRDGIKSCRLVMGYCEMVDGSVWNTFPPHVHSRRSEIYFYFDLNERILMHFMGDLSKSRYLIVHNEQAVLCPPWSIHCGCGQGSYKFVWGMAGENQEINDVDLVNPTDLR